MIKIFIADIAQQNGLKNAYALQRALNCAPSMASRLWKGNFKLISVKTVEDLCELFRCNVSDLMSVTPENAPDTPKLAKQIRDNTIKKKLATEPRTFTTTTPNSEKLLTTKECAERLGLSRKRINDFIVSGELPAIKGKQNHNFVAEADLEKFQKNRS